MLFMCMYKYKMFVTYRAPLADVETKPDRAACVVPGWSASASPNRRATAVQNLDRPGVKRCLLHADAAEVVRRAPKYGVPRDFWRPAGRKNVATTLYLLVDVALARRDVFAIAQDRVVVRRGLIGRCANRTRIEFS